MTHPLNFEALLPADQLSLHVWCPTARVSTSAAGNALLAYLIQERGCSGYGVEIDDSNVQACVARVRRQ
jgi:hypothetical protein